MVQSMTHLKSETLELGLNYAAAFNLKKSQDLPKQFTYKGIKLNFIMGI